MDINIIKNNLNFLFKKDTEIRIKTETLKKNIDDVNHKIENSRKETTLLMLVSTVLAKAADTARKNAKNHFEKIITNALQFVTQSNDYEFVIQEKNSKNKIGYEFYIKSIVNGVECLQRPEDANGGGFVDIISTAAKYAYLEVFSDPRIMNATLFYDEPGKMISADMSIKFAEYLKFLGVYYGRQTIMITHNDNITNVADKTFNVTKDANGVSRISEIDNLFTPLFTEESSLQGG